MVYRGHSGRIVRKIVWPRRVMRKRIGLPAEPSSTDLTSATEVIRAAIESIPSGQWEAAYSLNLNRAQALRRIVLPQAARVAVPPLANAGGVAGTGRLASPLVALPKLLR